MGMYSFTLSLTLPPRVAGWSTPRPWHFTPRKFTRYPLHGRLGGLWVWCTGPENLDPSGIRPPHRPTISETDYDIPAHGSLGGFG